MKKSRLMEIVREVIEEELEIEENKSRKPGDVWQRKNGLWSAKSQGHRIAHFANRRSAEDHAKKSDTKFHPDFGKSLTKGMKNENKAKSKTEKDKAKRDAERAKNIEQVD